MPHFILLLGGVIWEHLIFKFVDGAKCSNQFRPSLITFKCSITEIKFMEVYAVKNGSDSCGKPNDPHYHCSEQTSCTTICHRSHY